MSGLRRAIVRQFARPSGFPGIVAGWIMAARRSNRLRNEWTVGLVDPRPGEALLEIGSGPGYALELALAQAKGIHLVGLDHSGTMIAHAGRRLDAAPPGNVLELVEGGTECLESWPQRFDAVWSVNVIQFVGDLERFYAVLGNTLKPGGRVVTTYQPRHRNPTRDDALGKAGEIAAALRAAGFRDIASEMLELDPVPAVAVTAMKPR